MLETSLMPAAPFSIEDGRVDGTFEEKPTENDIL